MSRCECGSNEFTVDITDTFSVVLTDELPYIAAAHNKRDFRPACTRCGSSSVLERDGAMYEFICNAAADACTAQVKWWEKARRADQREAIQRLRKEKAAAP